MIFKINNKPNVLIKGDILIDTNIILWTFYSKMEKVVFYQRNIYPNFINSKLDTCKFYTTIYNLFEAFNIIEKNEYDLYININKLDKITYKLKDFRNDPINRQKVKEIINITLKTIESAVTILDYNFDNCDLNEFYNNFCNHKYDMFDYSLLKCAINKSITCILTDDKDFCSTSYLMDQINIITANSNIN